jgi:hypothetical protein
MEKKLRETHLKADLSEKKAELQRCKVSVSSVLGWCTTLLFVLMNCQIMHAFCISVCILCLEIAQRRKNLIHH